VIDRCHHPRLDGHKRANDGFPAIDQVTVGSIGAIVAL
jgi:hypothetical protein